MLRADGYAVWGSPGGAVEKADTLTCRHCNTVSLLRGKTKADDLGGFCRMCMGHICGPCADQGSCVPFERRLEAMERRQRLLDAVGLP